MQPLYRRLEYLVDALAPLDVGPNWIVHGDPKISNIIKIAKSKGFEFYKKYVFFTSKIFLTLIKTIFTNDCSRFLK